MSSKERAVSELAAVLHVLGHPQRIRVIEELRDGEHDVNHLSQTIGCTHARVSQHLAKLRGLRLVQMRREGRHVFYRLANDKLARWLLEGLDFVESEFAETEQIRDSVREARESWQS